MRAIVCHAFEGLRNLALERIPTPEIRDGWVLIDTHAAGLSFATELIVSGRYQRKPPLPFTPGTEVAGVVAEVGAGVGHVAPGDRVVAALDWGGHAGCCLAHGAGVHPIPDSLAFAEATAFAISYPTSYGALVWRAGLAGGETLLVHGAAGGVGLAAVEIGKSLGATVIATARTDERAAFAASHGADHVIALGDGGFREAVKELSGGRGADVIFDPIGGETTLESLRCMAQGARLLTIGYASGTIPAVPANHLLLKNASLVGFNLGLYLGWTPVDERQRHGPRMAAMMRALMAGYVAGDYRPEVSHRFTIERFQEAMETLLARQVRGKSVVEYGDGER